MDKQIARMSGHVIICGYGRIGQAICRHLRNMGVECLIIDRDQDRADVAQEMDVPVLAGNATADQALLDAGVERASILVAALSNDSDNLFVALAARELNARLMVIARGEDKSIETRMLRAGVDRVVYPAQLGGGQIARLIATEMGHEEDAEQKRRLTDVMGFELQVYRIFDPGGATVGEIVARTGAIQVVAHIDEQDLRHLDPEPDHEVREGEAVILVTRVAAAPAVKHDGREPAGLPHDLSLGIPSIDEEHRLILDMVRRLDAAGADRSREATREVLTDLKEYTVHHFKHEESLLRSTDYPELDDHVAEHRALTRKVDQLLAECDHMHRETLVRLLDGWIRHHILEVDRRYAGHVAGGIDAVREPVAG